MVTRLADFLLGAALICLYVGGHASASSVIPLCPMTNSTPILPTRILTWARQNRFDAAVALVLIALLIGIYGFFPAFGGVSTLGILESSWNEENDYGHGYLVGPLIIGLLAWKFWKTPVGPRESNARYGLPVVLLGILLWIFAYRVLQWRVAVGSLTVIVWGTFWYLFGWRVARVAAMPIFLLCFAVPVPGLVQATNNLQVVATQFGFYGAQVFGVECLQSGTNIQSAVAGKWGFDIAEGCSGIRSLMAMVLIAAVYAYTIQLPLWRKILIFAAAVPLAILVNAIRIVTILLLAEYVSADFAAGIYHDYASFFIFPLGLIGMLGVHQILTLDRRVKTRVVRRMTTPKPDAAS